jgi:hypothetical protein
MTLSSERPTRVRGPTSDLILNGRLWDIYTPGEKTSVDAMVRAIAKKGPRYAEVV